MRVNIKEKIRGSFSNWGRLHVIIKVLASHGFAGLLTEIGLPVPLGIGKKDTSSRSIPEQLRHAFEELGPTFIKLGQILSTRPDLLPPEYIKEFSKLTDQIPSFSFEEVKQILTEEFGSNVWEIFEQIEEEPIAAASISQVHRAKLKNGNLTDVVVKIQRPRISESIQSDIQILYFLAQALEKLRNEFRLFNLTGIVQEFQRTIYEELDFSLEAKNMEAFASNMAEDSGVLVPQVIWKATSKRVLTMTEIKGIPLSQLKTFPENVDRKYLAESLAQLFLESMFFHGLFHCDAHAGNLIVQTEGRGKIGLIDFGMVGRMTPDLREKMSKIFVSLVSRDFENLALLYAGIADVGKNFSLREFKLGLERLFSPNLNKALGEIDVGQMMLESIEIARKCQIRPPRDLILFYRSVVTLEAIGRMIDPEFDFLSFGTKFSRVLIQKRFSAENLKRDLFKAFEGLYTLGTEVPTQIKSLLYKIETDSLFPQLSRLDEGIKAFRRSNQLMSLAVVLLGLLVSSTILSQSEASTALSWIMWCATAGMGVIFLFRLFRS